MIIFSSDLRDRCGLGTRPLPTHRQLIHKGAGRSPGRGRRPRETLQDEAVAKLLCRLRHNRHDDERLQVSADLVNQICSNLESNECFTERLRGGGWSAETLAGHSSSQTGNSTISTFPHWRYKSLLSRWPIRTAALWWTCKEAQVGDNSVIGRKKSTIVWTI